ncbi:pentatricopeptide repeat-containing protein At5g66520-like [Hibiscus syriacus]|uniref:pentatricopeptide repeat-containing protein At5g66520-like n=1 Tax=Hibiscus syriacus TaxID=106335 RepID=UPI001924FB43|nr:pentatricopeptide repeat-containing protein At5g66520-like [Hibiscus syriacus]
MVGKFVKHNEYTFPLLGKICAEIKSLQEGGKIGSAREVFDDGVVLDLVSWNSMIDGYVKNGQVGYVGVGKMEVARELFEKMPGRDAISWNSMMMGMKGLKMFRRLDQETGEVRPNNASLVSVLTACATLGRLDKGLWVHSFIENNKIKCDVLLSTALLTMYAKCGAMDLARDVFDMEKRGQTPNAVTFTSCLSACKYSERF